MLVKTGPRLNSKRCSAVEYIEMPRTSLGNMSAVNCTRWKSTSRARAIVCAKVVLPTPGTPSMRRCPRAKRQTSERRTTLSWPRMMERSVFSKMAARDETRRAWVDIVCDFKSVDANLSQISVIRSQYSVPERSCGGGLQVIHHRGTETRIIIRENPQQKNPSRRMGFFT